MRLQAKEVRIGEEVSAWQETHSQIYDFSSATKLYHQELHTHELSLEALRQQTKGAGAAAWTRASR